MEIKEIKTKICNAPALIVFQDSYEKAGANGTILFYHGLKACKEGNLKELRSLAMVGFLAVGIDNEGHGERLYPDFEERLSSSDGFEKFFFRMVKDTIDEIPEIIDHLIKNKMSDPSKIGICGISMGGYITYGGILKDRRIKAAAPVLGSPKWKNSIMESPHHYPEKFFPTAILSQNAGKDFTVPAGMAEEFHNTLKPYYKEEPEREKFLVFPDSEHFMIESDWNCLWNNVVEWFERYL